MVPPPIQQPFGRVLIPGISSRLGEASASQEVHHRVAVRAQATSADGFTVGKWWIRHDETMKNGGFDMMKP